MVEDLTRLNQQWESSEETPYAIPEGAGHKAFCPLCHATGPEQEKLFTAMSDALVHKAHCTAVR